MKSRTPSTMRAPSYSPLRWETTSAWALVLAGVIAPTINGNVGDAAHIVAWLVLGADLIALAQIMLGRLR